MFRSNVNQLLEEKGMSTYALAEKSGISRQSLFKARQDAGISECRLSTLARIARALGVGAKDLFDEKGEP